MGRILILAIGTVLALLFILQMNRGNKYAKAVAGLDGVGFPFHNLYIAGFGWSSFGPLQFKGKLAAKLKQEASMLYETKYADYYAMIAWVGAITYVHLCLTIGFLLAGIMYEMSGFVLAVGVFMAIFMAAYSLTNMKNLVTSRKEECEAQLAEMVSTMAVLLNSGMVLREVWSTVSRNGEGALYTLMRETSDRMNTGMMEKDAFFHFGRKSNSAEIRKFTSAMLQSMEKGGAELSNFMQQQSSELWNTKRQKMLQSGEKAATKLLAPIMLIFVGIIIIVVTAAFSGSLFN